MVEINRISEILAKARRENRKNLMEYEAKEICKAYNISVTRFRLATNLEETVKCAKEFGYPVVLKIASPTIIHKSDVGGVLLNLNSASEVEKAYRTILTNIKQNAPESLIKGILVQEMAPSAVEVIVGAIKDPQFGPSIMFGLGGIFVEILGDVVFRIAPVTRQEAETMITEIKAFKVLQGYRNQPPADVRSVAEIISNTSRLVTDYTEIAELDLNPIMVYEKGAKTVDARIILE